MADYFYNPLLHEGLQKDSPVQPSDIQHIEEEITEINEDLKNKVPKFFASIEEIEVGEIGQYQGETNEDYTHGYFYKRGSGTPAQYEDITIPTGSKIITYTNKFDSSQQVKYSIDTLTLENEEYCYINQKGKVYLLDDTLHNKIITNYNTTWINNETSIIANNNGLFFLPHNTLYHIFTNFDPYSYAGAKDRFNYLQSVILNAGFRIDTNNIAQTGNIIDVMMMVVIPLISTSPSGIQTETSNTRYILLGDLANLDWDLTSYIAQIYALEPSPGVVSYDPSREVTFQDAYYYVMSIEDVRYLMKWTGANGDTFNTLYRTISADGKSERYIVPTHLNDVYFANPSGATSFQNWGEAIDIDLYFNYTATIDVASEAFSIRRKIQQYDEYGLPVADVEAVTRINTQPALNPADFATSEQGEKADTALQSINKGTDGDYITTTVGTKDNNNNQSIGVSAKIQDISTADDDNKGILESNNAKKYIDKQIYDISQNFQFYGVQWDTSKASPDCTRIGNLSLHAELPIQNSIVGGLLQDDLTFTPFPDQSDWSNETLDGSAGQVMVRIPSFYCKFETHGTINKVLLSEYPLPGYTKTPLIYVSTQKATVDRTDPNTIKLASVVNTTLEFRGGQNTAAWDNTYRSLLGKPATNISLTDFRQYARNRGNGTAWNCHTYLAQKILYWLFIVEYATLNSQKEYNAAKDANGYAQGGLGPGVSDWDSNTWLAYNNHNPLIPCGYMLEYGNQSAIKNYNVLDANGNILHTFSVNSYRGIQSPFGDIWDWTDGILINVQSNAAGGMSTCYITDDPAKFSSTNFSQYTKLGNTPRAEDWIKTIFNDEQGNIICKTQGGSSTSYYCDFYWGTNLPASGVSLRGVRFGGNAFLGARCGFLCALSYHVPAHVYPNLGSRLCAIPPP